MNLDILSEVEDELFEAKRKSQKEALKRYIKTRNAHEVSYLKAKKDVEELVDMTVDEYEKSKFYKPAFD